MGADAISPRPHPSLVCSPARYVGAASSLSRTGGARMRAHSSPTVPSSDQLALLNRVIKEATRSRRMSAEDAEDFAQWVQLRLLERAYDVFDRFTGKSSLRTYLTVVVRRMLLDWQNSEYGKWRPSAAAVRLGD